MNNPVTRVDEWRANYDRKCENCGQVPCVQGYQHEFSSESIAKMQQHHPAHDRLVYDGTLCGVCTWGEAVCSDPANW